MGGFWLGHLAMIRENDLLLRKIEKCEFFTSEQVRGFCVQNPLQGLVTASSSDCHLATSQAVPLFGTLNEKIAQIKTQNVNSP